jgi:hypothetical protein
MRELLKSFSGTSRDAVLSLGLATLSFMIYLSNLRTIGSGDTVPASLLPIILLTEGSVYFDSYEKHYENSGYPIYFFRRVNGRTVSNYPGTGMTIRWADRSGCSKTGSYIPGTGRKA